VFYLQGTHKQLLEIKVFSHKQMVELVLMVNPTKHLRLVHSILYGGLTANTISATTYLNLPSSAGGSDIRVTGGTYSNGTALFTNNTGGTTNVTGFSTGSSTNTTFTGGTVTVIQYLLIRVTANTVSATTYFNYQLILE
jgi:hypothetical protein